MCQCISVLVEHSCAKVNHIPTFLISCVTFLISCSIVQCVIYYVLDYEALVPILFLLKHCNSCNLLKKTFKH
jgi:hypothetical protein